MRAYRRGWGRRLERFSVLRRRGSEARFGMLLQCRQSTLRHWHTHLLGKLCQSCISNDTCSLRQPNLKK